MILSEEFYFKPYLNLNAGEPHWLPPEVADGWCHGLVEDWIVDALTAAEPWSGNLDSRCFAAMSRQRAYNLHWETTHQHERRYQKGEAAPSEWHQRAEEARRRSGPQQQAAIQTQYQALLAKNPALATRLKGMRESVHAHLGFARRARQLKGISCTVAYAANPASLHQLAYAAVTEPRSAGLMMIAAGPKRNSTESWCHTFGYAPWRDGSKRIMDITSAQWIFEAGVTNETVAYYIERFVARAGVQYWPGKPDVLCVVTHRPPGPGCGVELLDADPIEFRRA